MSGQRGQLTGIHGFIKREQNNIQTWIVAVFIQQRFQCVNIFGLQWNIGAFITAEFGKHIVIVVTECARMDLHNHSIFNTHTR